MSDQLTGADIIRSTPAIKVDQPELPESATFDDTELDDGHWDLFNPTLKITHTSTWAHCPHAEVRKIIATYRRDRNRRHTSDTQFPKKTRNRKQRLFLKGWRTRYRKPMVVEFTETYSKPIAGFMREWVSHLQGTLHPDVLVQPPSGLVKFTNSEAETAFVDGLRKIVETTPPPSNPT